MPVMGPLVTIITPCRNHGRFIRQTIESVLGQDYSEIEYLVIDGQSTDETVDILREYDGRLRWSSEPDRGQSHAINKGLSAARGDIIGWINADDTYEPGAISTIVRAFVQHPDVMLVYGDGNLMTESGRILGRFPYTQRFDLWKLVKGLDYIQQPSCFFRKEAVEIIDRVDEGLNWCLDWDLWIRIGRRFNVLYVPACLSNGRIYVGTKTSQGGLPRIREILAMLKKYNARLRRRETAGLIAAYLKSITFERLIRLFGATPMFGVHWRKRLRSFLFDSQGVYDDGSLGKKAHFLFPLGMRADTIVIDLERLDTRAATPLTITAIVNGRPVNEQAIASPGVFSVAVPYDGTLDMPTEVILRANRAFVHGRFWRRRSCMLRGTSTSHRGADAARTFGSSQPA